MFEFAGAAMEVWAVHRLFSALPQRSIKWKTPLLIAAAVSYTHLDVYKRQLFNHSNSLP